MNPDFDIESYQYTLPQEQIAQFPAEKREQSRLLVLDRRNNRVLDKKFTDILDYIDPGDLLVVNDTRVFPARLAGRKETGGRVELFLLEYPDFGRATVCYEKREQPATDRVVQVDATGLLKSSKKPKIGARLLFDSSLEAEILNFEEDGKVRARLFFYIGNKQTPENILAEIGRIPLPPYIQRLAKDHPQDRERYQTLFARRSGAVAAPTAGLHFSEPILRRIQDKNIQVAPITLHVGYGTFAPVRVRDIRDHGIHEEYVEIGRESADMINRTIQSGKNIWPVGTTTVRTLEYAAAEDGTVKPGSGWCGLYIYPGYRFRVVDRLITNFHLPGSSLLFLVAALAGRDHILQAYAKAVQLRYRFYSYGDAMLIIS